MFGTLSDVKGSQFLITRQCPPIGTRWLKSELLWTGIYIWVDPKVTLIQVYFSPLTKAFALS